MGWGRRVMHGFAAFRREAQELVAAAAKVLGHAGDLPPLEKPPQPEMGDLGLPCFTLAKVLRKSPQAIAQDLARAVGAERHWVHRVEAHGPYVNFAIDRLRLAREVLSKPEAAMSCTPKGVRVLLEHTSANPNGPLHVGRARNPIVGDTLARLYRAAGYDVEVQYYMDNLGRQVATLAWGKWNLDPSTLPPATRDKPDHDLVRYYQAAHDRAKNDPTTAAAIRDLVERLESADPALLRRVREVYEACFSGMRQSLDRLGARYDSVKDESDLVADGSVQDVMTRMMQLPLAGQEDDGARFLDLSHVLKGQKDKFYFARKDGTSVYATRDVAYHAWKARKVAGGHLVNVLGEDHRLQALQVGTALDALGVPRPHVVFYAFVSLPEGKMSTRANRVVFLDDLLDEAAERAFDEVTRRRPELPESDRRVIAEAVGIAAVRYNIARIQPEKPIEFLWEEALSFDGDTAPYLMYTHARMASLVRKAEADGIGKAPPVVPGPAEQRLLWVVAHLPGAVEDAVAQAAPQRFAAYASQLASALNEYYRDHRVLECEDPGQQALRLATVRVGRLAMARALDALGIPALDSM